MKILFISCHTIWPSYGGRENTIKKRIEWLNNHNYEVHIFYSPQVDDVEKKNEYLQFNDSKVSFFSKCKGILKSIFCKKFPLQSALVISNNVKRRIKKVLQSYSYDYVIVDMIRLAPLYDLIHKYSNAKLILDLDDIISKRYDKCNKSILGQSSKKNSFFQKLLQISFINKFIIKLEKRRLQYSEIYYSKKYDSVFLVNFQEVMYLNEYAKSVIHFPVVIDINKTSLPSIYMQSDPVILCFLGLLKTPANMDSLINILENIIPFLSFDYEFRIFGVVSDSFKIKYSNKKIKFLGFVEDLPLEMKKCHIFLSPILYGTGIKTKILEAMANGVPVITNSIGASGLDISDDSICIIDDNDKIISFLNSNYNNISLFKEISEKGYDYVKKNHSIDKIEQIFKKVLD